ncbi:MAG TPA: SAM-dependent chlorinase/fluorinase [Bacteroidia bacterium]|nr:SAM-dependent chlorinase/fluorinase [Bacteroidia bacterium]
MAIITLTSDAGNGYYTAAVKGAIYSEMPNVTVVDITNSIEPFDMLQAAFILKNSYSDFPKGSIHIVDVNAFTEEGAKNILILFNGHYFIGADNGLFSLVFNNIPEKKMELTLDAAIDSLAFPMRDIFVKAACNVAKGISLEDFTRPLDKLTERTAFKPSIDKNSIRGLVIFVDNYKNIFCNIDRETFETIRQNRNFTIALRHDEITTISQKYNDVAQGEILAMFSHSGFLEIAMNQGAASTMLNLKKNDQITIHFDD